MNWPEDRSRLIADAYELRGQKGVALLSRMGSFDLWRGSLALMRGDSSIEAAIEPPDAANTERFLQTLSVSRALDRMPDKCADVLRHAYSDKSDGLVDDELTDTCATRVLAVAAAIYQELSDEMDEVESDIHPAIPPSASADYDRTPAERK